MTDVTEAAQAGYRGDVEKRPAYPSSPDWCAYVAGMAHRLAGGQYPTRATTGRGYRTKIGTRSYDAYGPECAEARLTIMGSKWATSQRRANPTLMVVGNPPRRRNSAEALPEGRTLGRVIERLKGVQSMTKSGRVYDVLAECIGMLVELAGQAAKGIHRNPAGQQLARRVLRLDYVHTEDGKEYTHDFTEDPSKVTATVVEDGRKVILKAVDGRRIVEDF